MIGFQVVLGLALIAAAFADAVKLVDPSKCPNGCQTPEHCPKDSECQLLTNSECGYCVCSPGFKIQGNKCKKEAEKKGGKTTSTTSTSTLSTTSSSTTTTTGTTTSSATTTTTQPTTTTTQSTTTGTTTQSPTPPSPDPVVCNQYACTASTDPTKADPNCKRQVVTSPRPCHMQGGGSCYGVYCLTVAAGNDYCICPLYKTDRTCAVDKPGSCDSATGTVQQGYTQLQGKRLRNKSDKDNGSIYGRHFAASLNDCIKMCQWSQGQCRSVNFGQINGANVCEMLSIAATERNLLASWLEPASGWTYQQVGVAN